MPPSENTKHPTEISAKLSTLVSQRIQILDVRLLETRAEHKPFDSDNPGSVTTNIHVENNFNEQSKLLKVFPHFSLVVSQKDDSPENVFLRIEARFSVTYSLNSSEGLLQENYNAFGERNGVYNVWPYWREFVHSITSRMGLPPLIVPVYVIGESQTQQDVHALPVTSTNNKQSLPENNDNKKRNENDQ